MDRRWFVARCAAAGASLGLADALWGELMAAAPLPAAFGPPGVRVAPPRPVAAGITREMIKAAEALVGVANTDEQRELMLDRLEADLAAYRNLREVSLPNEVAPALRFEPLPIGRTASPTRRKPGGRTHNRRVVRRPAAARETAFLSVMELAALIRTRQITSTELTAIYLERLRRHNPALRCVVNLTEELALRQAAQADNEIAAGRYRGPLHGIPYGVKDILAVPGYPTTWGARIYSDRIIDSTATVVERLRKAGAVLVAKLSMGELGLSDRWYGGQTMNPWNPTLGAYGSSAGSSVAVSAGLVAFAIGAETVGSIVAPATRSGVTGLRPTFGRVSRHGAMTLCWSLDKLGPIAREVEDCAVVLEAIHGPDGKDSSVAAVPFEWDPDRRLASLRVGYFEWAFEADHETKSADDAALDSLRALGVKLIPIEMPTGLPVNSALLVRVEAAAALEEVEREHGLDSLAVQDATGWPNFVRANQFIPAVEYIKANRIRSILSLRMAEIFDTVDVFMAPTFGVMPITNLTGHPCLVLPNGLTSDGLPTSISFIGRLYGESSLCTVGRAWQDATGFHRRHPAAFTN